MRKKIQNLYLFFSSLLKLNITKSILIQFKIKSNNWRRFPVLLYGKSSFSIHSTASINIISGKFIFNDGRQKFEPFFGFLKMEKNSKLNVKGAFTVYSGGHIILAKDANINLGSGYINRNVKIRCFKSICIGENVAISENVTIWDSDVHEMVREGYVNTAPINIGNHVWIGTGVIILKGVSIGDNSIISAGSVVSRSVPANCLAAGNPAKIIKRNVSWK